MTAFYISIIFAGIIITGIALVMLVAGKIGEREERGGLREGNEALQDTIEEAELLVEELNRFSDHVVMQCEAKQQEVCQVMNRAETLIGQLSAVCALLESRMAVAKHASKDPSERVEYNVKPVVLHEKDKAETKSETATEKSAPTLSRGKVINLESRKAEVLRMARSGMTHTEIAKALNMGKGEIALIEKVGAGT